MIVSAVRAGAVYFAVVFAIGFVLGTLRTLFVVALTGELLAVLWELPVILAASWFASLYIVKRFDVAPTIGARLTMGLCAIALLLTAEWLLSVSMMGRSLAEHLAHYRTLPGAIGLAGQVVFATFPLLQRGARNS